MEMYRNIINKSKESTKHPLGRENMILGPFFLPMRSTPEEVGYSKQTVRINREVYRYLQSPFSSERNTWVYTFSV